MTPNPKDRQPVAVFRYHESVPAVLHGIVTALVTPFRPDDERIDCFAWQTLVDAQIAAGIHGLFVGGSTGEFFSQSFEERTVAIRFVRQAAQARIPVYANVGCITTRETIRLAHAAEAEGVDVLAVVTPYYIRPSQAELVDHYTEICRAVRLPVLAYNFPRHGGVDLLPETLTAIARQCDNLAGVKDSSGSIQTLAAYCTAVPSREFAVFIGPESLAVKGMSLGCVGVVSGSANIAPRLYVDLFRAIRAGDSATAARLQSLVDRVSACVPLHTFPSIIKEAVAIAGPCRKPVGAVPADARERLAAVLAALEQEGYLDRSSGRVTA